MAAGGAARVLSNQEDIINLFKEDTTTIFEFLSKQGLIVEEMICDKCMPIDAAPGAGEVREMYLIHRNGNLFWRCTAPNNERHERAIRHHSEFFTSGHETTGNSRNNSNRLSMKQILILTWTWCYDLSAEAAAQSARCTEKAALGQYRQCRRVCFAALDDRDSCPEAELIGAPEELVQAECSVKVRRTKAANGRGRLGPGDHEETHRGNAAEQAAIADENASSSGDHDEEEQRYHRAEMRWKSLQCRPCASRNALRNRTKRDPHMFMNFLNLISRVYPL